MATFITNETKAKIQQTFAQLRAPVRLVYFTSEHECGACAEQHALLEAIAGLSGLITLEGRELTANAAEAARYGVDKVPATIVLGERDYGIRFVGLTGGYELGSLIEAIVMVSTGRSGLDPAIEAMARAIKTPTHLEVMVTLTCPYCPRMVRLAHQLAYVNDRIRAHMVDAAEFPALVTRYHVHGVPLMVINGRRAFEGALPAEAAVLEILKEVEPDEYDRIDAAMREARGERKAVAAAPGRTYDIVVVGAGPAGLSASLYAVRKGRQVALIGKKVGGQVNDTASVENYLGMTHIGGRELAEQFRNHVEAYPVAERCRTAAKEVRRAGNLFEVVTEDGQTYRGRAVIYAAGKQYRTLGVPGEERFIGRGIAFCATCDAPLYRDKRVAVVGGGNSALTAVRDLRNYAREIHVVQNLPHLTADTVLVDEVKGMPNVKLHLGMEVREFLGDDRLTGVRLSSGDGQTRYDLAVDGVFLEIGLVPNAEPVRGLLPLNDAGEVPIRRDQSTSVPGFFAAGDVTDEPEKQIIIAAGDGARAALAADRYLASLEQEHARHGTAPAVHAP